MGDAKEQANALKVQGNESLSNGNYWAAVELYSKALNMDPENAALFSNRSVAYAKSSKFAEALDDAEKAIEFNKGWAKGYVRKGNALQGMKRYEEAMMAFMEGLDIEPQNSTIKQAITECKSHLTGPSGSQPLASPFADAKLWEKIRENATTREYMADPEYKQMVEKLHSNPNLLSQYMQDSRIMNTLGMLLGVELSLADDEPPSNDTGATNTLNALNKVKEQAKQKLQEDSSAMEVDDSENQQKALQEKQLGNQAYKKKDFATALDHYNKAIEYSPTDVTFRTNKAAVYFEQAEYDKCIEICHQAIDIGRENRADYKLIAKAFARIGNAYFKKQEYQESIKYFNKSLSESRDREIATKVQEIQKLMKENERLAYLNPEVALEEKAKGNDFFTKGKYPEALHHYTESIQRNPDDARVYSNRAACYTKLAEFQRALKDAEMCIKLDPKFVKGYLRKGNILFAMKESQKAADAFQKVLELDSKCQEAIDGYRKSIMLDSSNPEDVRKRAMQNPEVQEILADPAMQLILQQMQKDPRALQEHLKNPNVAKKIEKLLECGLIAIR